MKIKKFKKNMIRLINTGFSVFMLSSIPLVTNAEVIQGVIFNITRVLNRLIPLIIGIALLIFLWGIVLYVIVGSDKDKEKAKGYMIWGIISLFVMTSVWGLVRILSDTIFGNNMDIGKPPSTPTITNVGAGNAKTFAGIVGTVMDIILKGVVPLILTLSLVVFLWGIVKYISAGGNEVKIGEGVKLITYGLVGLFVMFAVWGLVGLLLPLLGSPLVVPQFK